MLKNKCGICWSLWAWIAVVGLLAIPAFGAEHVVNTNGLVFDPAVLMIEAGDTVRASLEGFAAAIAGTVPYPVTHDQVIQGVAAHEAIGRVAGTDGGPITVESSASLRAAAA